MLRFAISPTEDMHIDSLRAAIFNYILSKQLKEDLIIRIDDTEKEKNIEGKDKEFLELLSLFSIDYSHTVYQSENLKYHQKLIMQLMNQKKAFSCFCGDAKLEELKQTALKEKKPFVYDGFCETLSDETVMTCNAQFTVRIQKPKQNITFTDTLKGEQTFTPDLVDAYIALTHDKTPTYNYACAVDDMLYDISSVIRDEKNLSNTAKQIYTRNLLNYDKEINYTHLSSIKNSKDFLVKDLITQGFLPSAIANYLVLLGNKAPKEIFTLEEAIEWFDIKTLSNDISFDIEKLKEINKKHLAEMDDLRFSKILGFADSDIGKLGKLFLNDSSTIKEIKSKIALIFAPKSTCEGFEEEFVELKLCIQDAPFFNNLEDLKTYITQKTNLQDKKLETPLNCILTGKNDGPAISDIYPLIKNYLGEIIK